MPLIIAHSHAKYYSQMTLDPHNLNMLRLLHDPENTD